MGNVVLSSTATCIYIYIYGISKIEGHPEGGKCGLPLVLPCGSNLVENGNQLNHTGEDMISIFHGKGPQEPDPQPNKCNAIQPTHSFHQTLIRIRRKHKFIRAIGTKANKLHTIVRLAPLELNYLIKSTGSSRP